MNELMDYTKFVKVKCDWQSNVEGLDIENCVVARLQKSEHETPEVDIMGLIEESSCNCVNFSKPDDQSKLFLNMSCDSRYSIAKVFVCSEAKIIEFFGKTGEYVSTHPAYSSTDCNEFPMNSHSIRVDSTECSLKFEQLKNSDFVWIYGILVYLTETKEHSKTSLGPINMQNVQRLLNPESLATNASKLISTLSLRESKSNNNDILNSILKNFENTKLLDSNNSDQFMYNSFKQFEKRVDERLENMAVQLNTFGDNIDMLNKKFDKLLGALNEKNLL